MKVLPVLFVALAISALGTASAHADDFNFSFTGDFHGNGTFSTSPTSDSGVYQINGITGSIDGVAISGLIAAGSFDFNDDTLYYPQISSSYVDPAGISFTDATGESYNLYIDPGQLLIDYSAPGTGIIKTGEISSLDISPAAATPEPDSLLLLGTGALVMGGTIRRRLSA